MNTSFETLSDEEESKKAEDLKKQDKIEQLKASKESFELAKNVATEMLDTYLEHSLLSVERYKKVWLDDNPRVKNELIEMIAKEMSNNYKLIDVEMLTRAKVKKNMREYFIPRKMNQILKKNGIR